MTERHRRPVPAHELIDGVLAEERAEERSAWIRSLSVSVETGWQARNGDHHSLLGPPYVQPGHVVVVYRERLLNEKDASFPGEAGHQVLRSLENKVPPKMAEADQIWQMGQFHRD